MEHLRIIRAAPAAALQLTVTPAHPVAQDPPGGDVLFERDVPEGAAVLNRVAELLASSAVPGKANRYTCDPRLAVRAVELAVSALWPTRRLQCPDCHQHFVIPFADRRRMYLACPHCHNPMLNPAWDSA